MNTFSEKNKNIMCYLTEGVRQHGYFNIIGNGWVQAFLVQATNLLIWVTKFVSNFDYVGYPILPQDNFDWNSRDNVQAVKVNDNVIMRNTFILNVLHAII